MVKSLGVLALFFFLYFLLLGPFRLIDFGFKGAALHVFNLALSLLFFLQHSVMIRKSFKAWLSRFLAESYHGLFYTAASSATLFLFLFLCQDSELLLARAEGLLRMLLRVAFVLALAGFFWASRTLGSFDAFGDKAASSASLPEVDGKKTPTIRGPYLWVRHPFYFFTLLLIWSQPELTCDRLLFNLSWTLWIFLGTVLEERDLVSEFGKSYQDYQKQVPMLLPLKLPGSQSYYGE